MIRSNDEWIGNGESMLKMDCFAYDVFRRSCTALRERKCGGCEFYKSKEQHKADQRKVVKRLMDVGYVAVDGCFEIGNKKYPVRGF